MNQEDITIPETEWATWTKDRAEHLKQQLFATIQERDKLAAEKVSLVADRDAALTVQNKQAGEIKTLSAEIAKSTADLAAAKSALNDAADKIASLTNERDGLLERFCDKIAAEKKAAEIAQHQADIAKGEAAKVALAKFNSGGQ